MALISESGAERTDARVAFVDVGQGDCTVVAVPPSGILIDCPSGRAEQAIDALRQLGVARLALAMISHWHADHYGGVLAVASAIGCDEIRYNHDTLVSDKTTPKSLRAGMLLRLIGREFSDVRLAPATRGERGSMGGIEWEILGPDHRMLTYSVARTRPNSGSVILRVEFGGARILIAGDADGESWRRVAAVEDDLHSDVLRCSHHGAMDSTGRESLSDDELMNLVRPKYVAVSVGSRNDYGHPRDEVFAAALGVGARVLCTQATSRCGLVTSGGDFPCAGTVKFSISSGGDIEVDPSPAQHQARISDLGLSSALCGVQIGLRGIQRPAE